MTNFKSWRSWNSSLVFLTEWTVPTFFLLQVPFMSWKTNENSNLASFFWAAPTALFIKSTSSLRVAFLLENYTGMFVMTFTKCEFELHFQQCPFPCLQTLPTFLFSFRFFWWKFFTDGSRFPSRTPSSRMDKPLFG